MFVAADVTRWRRRSYGQTMSDSGRLLQRVACGILRRSCPSGLAARHSWASMTISHSGGRCARVRLAMRREPEAHGHRRRFLQRAEGRGPPRSRRRTTAVISRGARRALLLLSVLGLSTPVASPQEREAVVRGRCCEPAGARLRWIRGTTTQSTTSSSLSGGTAQDSERPGWGYAQLLGRRRLLQGRGDVRSSDERLLAASCVTGIRDDRCPDAGRWADHSRGAHPTGGLLPGLETRRPCATGSRSSRAATAPPSHSDDRAAISRGTARPGSDAALPPAHLDAPRPLGRGGSDVVLDVTRSMLARPSLPGPYAASSARRQAAEQPAGRRCRTSRSASHR